MKPGCLTFRATFLLGIIAIVVSRPTLGATPAADAPVPVVKTFELKGNPFWEETFTADPAPLVVGDTLYLYTGHDEAKGSQQYTMHDWQCFSTKDMKTWTYHGILLSWRDFKWARGDAWASQVIQKDGKFYWFVTVQHDNTRNGKAIGVAVSDSPTGPFKDARGSALVTEDMTRGGRAWDDIDPTVWTDTDGTTWMFWGNGTCYYAKLKPNLIELDGPIQKTNALQGYTEGPWIYKRGDLYYLVYASMKGGSENISCATSDKITGPWTNRGEIVGNPANSYTTHPGVVEFKGQWYMFYHNGAIKRPVDGGGSFRRSVCIDYLYYNPDGTIKPVVQTTQGITVPPVRP
jgi:arabinoxylan arabinofuranohydrolase